VMRSEFFIFLSFFALFVRFGARKGRRRRLVRRWREEVSALHRLHWCRRGKAIHSSLAWAFQRARDISEKDQKSPCSFRLRNPH
jgi:hypothetical protein